MRGILGKKLGMSQIFSEQGEVIPVTVIQAGPCYVTQVKTPERDGYAAIQLGFEEIKPSRLTKPQRVHLTKHNAPALRYLREIRTNDIDQYQEGQKIDVGIFQVGMLVDVTGISKGRGFAGVVKRHGFGGGPKTHGQSDRWRAPGAISAGSTPGRVFKGLRMAGRMGNECVTIQNLEVVMVDPARNLLVVKGAVPGARNGLLVIREARKTTVSKKRR
ncbi:MAG: 50S ribosomal protein L3 [Ardenticatenia bacterium]|jgi:large subunit ribosomal protein L3|nr:MAG: 50S ribosomal protein L3 [Ardenticatenia bacterium]